MKILQLLLIDLLILVGTGACDKIPPSFYGHENDQFELACWEGNVDLVKHELLKGYNPTGYGKITNEPILNAIMNGQDKVVKVLLDAGVDPNFDWGGGKGNLLTNAAQCGHLKVVQVLVESGANVNRSVEHSPLFRARITGRIEVEQYLKSKGAQFNANDTAVLDSLK